MQNIKQKVGTVIVVRTSSKRLPNKALCKIIDQESITVLIKRMKRINNSHQIILATSTDKSDDILEKIAIKEGVSIYRGSLNNVALRYYEAAKKFELEQIVRITGDAIMCDEIMLEKAIENQILTGSDVTFIKNMPYGTAKEVFNFKTIETIVLKAEKPENTEYLEWYLENSKIFNISYIKSNYIFDESIRLTLDFKEDLILFNKIFEYFKSDIDRFTLYDVLVFLKNNPEMIKINSHLTPKFSRNDLNLNIKNV